LRQPQWTVLLDAALHHTAATEAEVFLLNGLGLLFGGGRIARAGATLSRSVTAALAAALLPGRPLVTVRPLSC